MIGATLMYEEMLRVSVIAAHEIVGGFVGLRQSEC